MNKFKYWNLDQNLTSWKKTTKIFVFFSAHVPRKEKKFYKPCLVLKQVLIRLSKSFTFFLSKCDFIQNRWRHLKCFKWILHTFANILDEWKRGKRNSLQNCRLLLNGLWCSSSMNSSTWRKRLLARILPNFFSQRPLLLSTFKFSREVGRTFIGNRE